LEEKYTAEGSSEKISFIQNTDAYIPFAVIGIFIVLAATFASVYLLKMDSEVAETIYTTEKSNPKKTAVNLATSDLARCLNYAGMQALEWQGEHPVILPEGTPVERLSEDGFSVIPKNQNLEKGDTVQISINLPSDVWGKIESFWKNKDIRLIVKDSKGSEIKNVNYGTATGFFRNVAFEESAIIPDSTDSGYASIELYYGDELKASDWFLIEISPVKDIAAESFNKLLSANYQGNSHTFMEYAINVNPDIKPEQIKIRKVRGILQKDNSSSPDNRNYTIYYVFEIPSLNYTLVDLESREKTNSTIKLSTLITSREPILEELAREYENELANSSNLDSASNLVLGQTNLRTFVYGPWQHYANGPLNILTNPALSSSVNGATLYTQKKVFNSVDPLALTYTTYYNGKVLYEDIFGSGSEKTGSGQNSDSSNVSKSLYEKNKGVNLTTTYDSLAKNKSFSLDVEKDIENSLKDTNTSFEELSDSSKIRVSASDYTDGVLDGWVFNDHEWTAKTPDLIHNVTDSVYTAPVQAQILRDGFNSPIPVVSAFTANFDGSSVSFSGQSVDWNSGYFSSGRHTGSRVSSYSWNNSVLNSYSESLSPSIDPPRGSLAGWNVKSATVSLLSADITDVKIEPHYSYKNNDRLTVENRSEGYLNQENHVFDWDIRYDISYTIRTRWKIDYSYDYTYEWTTTKRLPDGTISYGTNSNTLSDSASETVSKEDFESFSHLETEPENLTVIYHKRPPTGGYEGISIYTDPTEREYRQTTVSYDSNTGGRPDPCCSDAADKYRAKYVDLRAIESTFWAYPPGGYLAQQEVSCDIPAWLHREMGEEVLGMLDSIKKDNPGFNYSLVDSPGRNPTELQVEASEKLIAELENNRERYVGKNQHLNSSGKINTSSDSARYIAKNEAYNKLLLDIEQKNSKLDSNLNSYILDALKERGFDKSALDSVTSGSMTLFNNPAIEKASSALGKNMGIITTMKIIGQPESKYNWTENMTLLVDQKPNYLYHDPDFDLRKEYKWTSSTTGKTIYPLGIRNTCIFTTGISEEIAEAIDSNDDYVKTKISQQMSQSISNINTEINLLEQNLSEQNISLDTTQLDTDVSNLKHIYSQEMRIQIPDKVADEISQNPVVSDWIKESRVREVITTYLDTLSDDQLIQKSTADDLSTELSSAIKAEIRNSNLPVGSDELEATLNRVDTDVRIGVSNGICAVTVDRGKDIDSSFGKIDSELKSLTNETVDSYSGEVGAKISKRMDRAMAAIPCGLPVLPPHWVFTVNLWTYEIVGKYQTFTIIDNDNEVIPKPYFGHKGQRYVREDSEVYDPIKTNELGYNAKLGDNKKISFKFNGYAASIVGPGSKGVGDKTGSSIEKSIAYEELLKEYGE
jgi:hypothetical protein